MSQYSNDACAALLVISTRLGLLVATSTSRLRGEHVRGHDPSLVGLGRCSSKRRTHLAVMVLITNARLRYRRLFVFFAFTTLL